MDGPRIHCQPFKGDDDDLMCCKKYPVRFDGLFKIKKELEFKVALNIVSRRSVVTRVVT
jgi:hypothetical protein